ncbi:MAG: right-handed parallel beta-helix repeat-containing protein [Methanobacterium sp.]
MTTKYVSGPGGGGDYVCSSGSTDCQDTINQALAWANNTSESRTVYLKGPYTYLISDRVLAGSNTVFTGDSTACIKVATSAPQFTGTKGFIGVINTNVTNLEISGFSIDGNCGARPASYADYSGDHDAERAVYLIGSSTNSIENISIHDLTIKDCFSDGIHVHWGKTVKIYKNDVRNTQHDCIFCVEVTGSGNKIYGNTLRGIVSDSLRLDNCQHVKIYDNDIAPYLDTTNLNGATRHGENGIQIANEGVSHGGGTDYPDAINDIEVYNNKITNTGLAGIWLYDTRGKGASLTQTVNIHHNTISGCGVSPWAAWCSGISVYKWGNGINIQYNTIDGCYSEGIQIIAASGSSAYSVDIKNNNIINTQGYGVYNKVPSNITAVISDNYFSGNTKGKYLKGTTSGATTNDATAYITAAGYQTDSDDTGGDDDDDDDDTNDDEDPTDVDSGGGGTDIPTPYIPSTPTVPTSWIFNYYIPGHTAYVNGVPINHYGFEPKVTQSLSDEHPPGTDEDNIGDFGEQAATYTVHCFEQNDDNGTAIENAWRSIAAWKGRTPTIFEPGGPYSGWYLQGVLSSRSRTEDLQDIDSNWYKKVAYDVDFLCDKAVYYSTSQRVRARKVYKNQQTWNSDNCYIGNYVQNGTFDSWSTEAVPTWELKTTIADNDWENVAWSSDLQIGCAVASTGTGNRVMVYENGAWRAPTGLSNAINRDNAWKGLVWCDDWKLWVASSTSGMSGYAVMTSPDADEWTASATPSSADGCAWGCALWIPRQSDTQEMLDSDGNALISNDSKYIIASPDEAGSIYGRVILFASSGTKRIMYSDDRCQTWTQITSPKILNTSPLPIIAATEINTWCTAAYSQDLHRIVVIADTGMAGSQVMTSDDFGTTWELQQTNLYNQKWKSCVWDELFGAFVAVSEDGEKQVMMSATGLGGSWALVQTPYNSVSRSTPSEVVSTKIKTVPTVFSSNSLTYKGDFTSRVYNFTFQPLTNGHVYRVEQISGWIKPSIAGKKAYMKVTLQFGDDDEIILQEWTNKKPAYAKNVYDLDLKSDTNELVVLRYYLRTSCTGSRTLATMLGFKVSEMTPGGSTITYTRNAWEALGYSPDQNLRVAIASSGTGNRVMDATDDGNWQFEESAADYSWSGICWAPEISTFLVVGKSGTGKRSMILNFPEPYADVAPDGWDLVTKGQRKYSSADNIDNFYEIIGDGVTDDRGSITQPLTNIEAGEVYVLMGQGITEGVTDGKLSVEIVADGAIKKRLTWDSTDATWAQKSISMVFDYSPYSAYIRVHGIETVNLGGELFANNVLFQKYSDFDITANGSSIFTGGNLSVVPDVKIASNSMTTTSVVVGDQVVDTYDKEDDLLTTTSKVWALVKTIALPALPSGSQYRLDGVFSNLATKYASNTVVMRVTIQSSGTSLYNGEEKSIAAWRTNTNVAPNYASFLKTTRQLADDGETITVKFYMKTFSAKYAAYASAYGIKYSVVTTAVKTGGVSIINTADPLTLMPLCNNLYPGCSIRLNADMTGAFDYSEDYRDSTWQQTVKNINGDVEYFQTDHTITLNPDSSIVYEFDTLCPVTGIPFVNMVVKSGIPQFYISGDNSTWYSVDSNTSTDLTDTLISRLLDSNANSFHLKGSPVVYIKIAPRTGKTCVIGASLIHCDLNTMDIPRIKLLANGAPQNIQAFFDTPANVIISLYSRDQQPVV